MRALLLVACCACAGPNKGDATFRVFYPDAPADGFKAKVGKAFFIKAVGDCKYTNGRDAKWSMEGARITSGKLPPGMTLEEGKISGTPVEAGSYSVAIEFMGVSCAGDKRGPQTVEVTIVAK